MNFSSDHREKTVTKNSLKMHILAVKPRPLKKILYFSVMALFLTACDNTNGTLEEKAAGIHARVLTIDSHTDTPLGMMRGFDINRRHHYLEDRSRLDIPRMEEGGLDAVFLAAFTGQRERDDGGNQKAFHRTLQIIDSILLQVSNSRAKAEIAYSPEDAYRLEEEGRRAIFIGIENGYALGSDVENVELFFNKGARYITLCHTRNNDLCDSSNDTIEHGGLSDLGARVVGEMNRLGMMVDVSHISDASFYDVMETTTAPVIASHSCARAICDNPRNLDDDMLKTLAQNGGVIQVCILSDYVRTPPPHPERDSVFSAIRAKYKNFQDLTPEESTLARKEWRAADSLFPRNLATVSDMVDHIDHIVQVAGIDHVGIGTDFDGGGGLADCRDVSEMGNITVELVRRGYSEEDIRKIWGGNLMRVMEEVMSCALRR